MEYQKLPNCACGAYSQFYCENHKQYLCPFHLKNEHLMENVYFYKPVLNEKQKISLENIFCNLKNKAENSLNALQQKFGEIIEKIQNVYANSHQEIVKNIKILDEIIDGLRNKEDLFIKSYPLFIQIHENEKKTFEDLPNSFDLRIVDKYILDEIPRFVKVFSNLSEIYSPEHNAPLISKEIIEQNQINHWKFKHAYMEFVRNNENDDLSEWFKCMEYKRNCEKMQNLHINGQNLNPNNLEFYPFLPDIYNLKEISIESTNSDDLENLIDNTLSKCTCIEVFHIHRSEISEYSSKNLGDILGNCKFLNEILITDCSTGSHIPRILENSDLGGLVTLVLSNALISDSGVSHLCKFFPKFFRLKYLHLDQNSISEMGGLCLRIYLKYLITLIEINLSCNSIGQCAGLIFESLSFLPMIYYIDLSSIDFCSSQENMFLENIGKMAGLNKIILDMTIPNDFLHELTKRAPPSCHVYRKNSDLQTEVKN